MKKLYRQLLFIIIYALFSIMPGNSGVAVNVNGTFYFQADDGTHGYELWKSNGTETGTVMVKDINPGSNCSYRRAGEDRLPEYFDY